MKTVALIGARAEDLRTMLSTASADVRAVVLAPDRAYANVLSANDEWTTWSASGRTALLIGPEYAGASAIAREFTDLHEAPVVVDATLQAERPDEVERARGALARVAFQATANEGARRASAGRYLLQTLANAPRLARESRIDTIRELAHDMPAIVVAAGPSLDRNVHDLAPVLDRAIVIACDTAARPLLSIGVQPDFIVGTDSSRANAVHLSSLPPSQSWLVAEGSLHPSAFTHFDRRTFIFRVADHHPWPWLRSMDLDAAVLDTWGSVATSSFSLALQLGCNPIIFAGADFAFTGDRPYCRGTTFEPAWAAWMAGGASPDAVWRHLIDRWPAIWETDVTGTRVRSASHLVSFRDWIVERAAAQPSSRIVNATGAGILTGAAIQQRSATSTLASLPPIDRATFHRHILAAHRSRTRRLDRVFAAVDRILAAGDPETIDAWMQFGSPVASVSALASVLRSHEYDAWNLRNQA